MEVTGRYAGASLPSSDEAVEGILRDSREAKTWREGSV